MPGLGARFLTLVTPTSAEAVAMIDMVLETVAPLVGAVRAVVTFTVVVSPGIGIGVGHHPPAGIGSGQLGVASRHAGRAVHTSGDGVRVEIGVGVGVMDSLWIRMERSVRSQEFPHRYIPHQLPLDNLW